MASSYAAAYLLSTPLARGPGFHHVGSARPSRVSAGRRALGVAADVLCLFAVVLAVPFLILAAGMAIALVVNILLRLLQVL